MKKARRRNPIPSDPSEIVPPGLEIAAHVDLLLRGEEGEYIDFSAEMLGTGVGLVVFDTPIMEWRESRDVWFERSRTVWIEKDGVYFIRALIISGRSGAFLRYTFYAFYNNGTRLDIYRLRRIDDDTPNYRRYDDDSE